MLQRYRPIHTVGHGRDTEGLENVQLTPDFRTKTAPAWEFGYS